MTGRIVIIPCGARKRTRPSPAGSMYVGSYHRACRRAADATGGRVLILSAKYGLLDLATMIEPYEQRTGKPGAITVAALRRQADEMGIRDARDVVVIAGKSYADLVSAVWPHARRPLDGTRGIGDQMRRLARLRVRP